MQRWLWLACLVAPVAAQEPVLFAHAPAVSPTGEQLAFVWRDDLWTAPVAGGVARPLTAHPAVDGAPVYSPDGQTIAFTSQRSGNYDVWLMAAGGGVPRRLTWHAGSDGVSDFTPDGRDVLFASRREGPALGAMRAEFLIPVVGGTPRRLMPAFGSVGAISPDGRYLAFVRGPSMGQRRGYRGTHSTDVWLHEIGGKRYLRLTDEPGMDTGPQWSADGSWLYFLSDRAGAQNVWRMRRDGSGAQQVTRHAEPVRSLALARRAPVAVYEAEDRLWRLDLTRGEAHIIDLRATADAGEPSELWEWRTSGVDEAAVAPSGKEVAFVVRGDVYIARYPDGGPTTRLTDTVAEEGGLAWSKDSRTLWFHSDRAGQFDLYALTSADETDLRLRRSGNLKLTRLTDTPVDEFNPLPSPDGKQLAFVRDRGTIVVADLELKQQTVISEHWSRPRLVWSPDSRWLAFSREDADFNTDVFLIPATGGEPTNVSQHPLADWYPTFAGDGSKLGFLSRRANEQVDAYFVWLQAAEWERTRADRAEAEDDAYDKPKPKPAEKKEGEEAKPEAKPAEVGLKIDLPDIHRRLTRLTSTVENEDWLAAAPDGKSFAYFSGGQLYIQPWDGARRAVGGAGSQLEWSSDGRSLRYLAGGKLNTLPAAGGVAKATEFSAEIRRSLAEERAYLFDRVWRIMGHLFYDPGMHGVDWAAVGAKHRARALTAPSRADFDLVVNDLLGELNASHMGFSSPRPGVSGVEAGELGIEWSATRGGDGLEVAAVVPGSPAARAESRIEPGERVLAVDGAVLGPAVNVNELLLGKTERTVSLTVRNAAGQERRVAVRAIRERDLGDLRYAAFVRRMRAEAERLSDGRVGYLHVQSMDQGSLDEFERDLFAAGNGRRALIVDVRWNSGGWTADLILSMLNVRQHAYTIPRGGEKGYPTDRLRRPTWGGPAVLLCNEQSFSNAEILAHAFKTLGRGPVVGWPTAGGVISTGGTRLVDGSSLRLPFRGWYRTTDGMDLENNPALPDVRVELTPDDEAARRDPQLEAAVKAALQEIARTD